MPGMTRFDRIMSIRRLELPWHARLIAYDLAARANAKGQCYPLQTTLAKANGVSIRTVERAIAYLRSISALHVEYGPNRNATYTLTLSQAKSNPSVRRVQPVCEADISCTTVKLEAETKPPPSKRIKPGRCTRGCRRPSLHRVGPCEECVNREINYRRALAQIK